MTEKEKADIMLKSFELREAGDEVGGARSDCPNSAFEIGVA
jgi:hypothetical protein